MLKSLLLAGLLCCVVFVDHLPAVLITAGNLVVVQVGDGSASLSSNATAGFVKEFTTAGSLVQTIALPTATAATALTYSGSATSEGFIQLSTDKQYLAITGYGATPGTAGVTTATPTAVNRVVGIIPISTGVVNASTRLTDAYSGSNIRSAFTTDGTNIWTAGNGGSGQGATAGVRYTTVGATTSTGLHSSVTNERVVNIQNNQLYSSSSSNTNLGINTIGTGVPTTNGQTVAELPGMPTSGTHSNYDFWFKDANTLYVADDGGVTTGGGIQKWVLSSGSWTLAYTLLNNGTTATATRGLAGTIDTNGNAILFATTAGSSQNNVITVTDTGAGSLASTVATAAANTVYRGVEYISVAAVPEASIPLFLCLVCGTIGGLRAFRRNRATAEK